MEDEKEWKEESKKKQMNIERKTGQKGKCGARPVR